MKIPKRAKIVANNSGNKFFDKYVGKEYNVLYFNGGDSRVCLETMIGHVGTREFWWELDEVAVLEWTEDDITNDEDESDTVTITRKEYEELLEYKAMYEGLDR